MYRIVKIDKDNKNSKQYFNGSIYNREIIQSISWTDNEKEAKVFNAFYVIPFSLYLIKEHYEKENVEIKIQTQVYSVFSKTSEETIFKIYSLKKHTYKLFAYFNIFIFKCRDIFIRKEKYLITSISILSGQI